MIPVLVMIFGLIIGSFLNVVIYRLPKKMSLAFPASHCPICEYKLKWYDNIPVLSYIILRGKCRSCHAKINCRYPLIELLNALMWLLAYKVFGYTWLFIIASIVLSVFIVIIFIDIDEMIIPDSLNLALLIIGIILLFLPNEIKHNEYVITNIDKYIGFGIGIAVLNIVLIVEKIVKKEIMGGGDIKLIAVVGLLLGWQLTLLGIVIGSFIGSIIELVLIMFKKRKRGEQLPFGPYLVFGFTIALFVGLQLIDAYISLF